MYSLKWNMYINITRMNLLDLSLTANKQFSLQALRADSALGLAHRCNGHEGFLLDALRPGHSR